jgi:rubrerythrin
MPITSFGGLLTFAEEMEKQDMEFYSRASAGDGAGDLADLMASFAKDGKKNVAHIQRTRRENVTEMILEPISGIVRESFVLEAPAEDGWTREQILTHALETEKRAVEYYTLGAEKIKTLAEVSRALKVAGKKRKAHLKKLTDL